MFFVAVPLLMRLLFPFLFEYFKIKHFITDLFFKNDIFLYDSDFFLTSSTCHPKLIKE